MAAYVPVITNFSLLPDHGYFMDVEEYVNNFVLVAGTALIFNVPANAKRVIIDATADIYVAYTMAGFDDKTAVVPAVNNIVGSGCVLNPKGRYVGRVTKISIISSAACTGSLAFFA